MMFQLLLLHNQSPPNLVTLCKNNHFITPSSYRSAFKMAQPSGSGSGLLTWSQGFISLHRLICTSPQSGSLRAVSLSDCLHGGSGLQWKCSIK